MCVFPRVRKNWDALSLGALGKRQGSRNAAQLAPRLLSRARRAPASCTTGIVPSGNPRLELLNPALPSLPPLPCSRRREQNLGGKSLKKNKKKKSSKSNQIQIWQRSEVQINVELRLWELRCLLLFQGLCTTLL